jgi:hypothetical protein
MTRPVLQTRIIGMTPDSRDLMRPPEIVYECKEPAKPYRMRSPLWARILIPLCLAYLAYGLVSAIVYIVTSGSVTI